MKNTRTIMCLTLILTMLALFAAPAFAETVETAALPEELTLEMIAEANSYEKLMESFSSYCIHHDYDGEYSGITYADSELVYDYLLDSAIVYANGQLCEFNEGAFGVRLYVGMEPNLEWTMGPVLYAPEEEIVEVVQDGEKLIVKTRYSEQDYGEETEEGYIEYIYEVDRQTLCQLGGSHTVYAPDGTATYKKDVYMEYDVERPAQAQELFDRMNPKEDYRTVTIVAEPGTENETVYSVNTARGDSARIYYNLDYKAFYTDPECTQVYEGGADTTQDLTLYVTKEEK